MAAAFPLGRRASGGYYTYRTRNGHGDTHEPSAGLGNPGGGSTAGKAPSANTSIRTLLSRLRGPAFISQNGMRLQCSDLYVLPAATRPEAAGQEKEKKFLRRRHDGNLVFGRLQPLRHCRLNDRSNWQQDHEVKLSE